MTLNNDEAKRPSLTTLKDRAANLARQRQRVNLVLPELIDTLYRQARRYEDPDMLTRVRRMQGAADELKDATDRAQRVADDAADDAAREERRRKQWD